MHHIFTCMATKINQLFLLDLPVIVAEEYKGNRLIEREKEQLSHYVYTCSNAPETHNKKYPQESTHPT